jgi:hypothetical protein
MTVEGGLCPVRESLKGVIMAIIIAEIIGKLTSYDEFFKKTVF